MKTKNYKTGLVRTTRIAVMLLLTLITSTPAWANDQLSQAPMGNIDGCQGGRLAVHVWGWTCDPYYEVWNKDVFFLNNTHWDGIERIVSPNDWIWTRTKLALSAFATQWYLANHNKAKIQLWKDGVKVKEVEVNPNVRRDDVVNYYKFYTEERVYHLYGGTENIFKSLDHKMGFDTWIEVDEPGNYHVVVYGTNVHGWESYDKDVSLPGERDVTVSKGYTITYDANTTDASVKHIPGTQYKSQATDFKISDLYPWPTRDGYQFVGWNTEPNGEGMHYDENKPYSTNADVKLYAQWIRSTFYYAQNTISSVDDWNDLATMVNNGYLHGQNINLVNDIGDENNPITRCIGTQHNPFDNVFRGNGHSIYVDINDTRHEGTAPFRCVGVVPTIWKDFGTQYIMNLKVKGTVRGGKYCSGLIGISKGVEAVCCAVQANVITNSTHCAGVIGYVDGTRQNDKSKTTSCIFSGTISGATQSTGIFIGARKKGRESTCHNCISTGTVSGANIDLAPPSEVIYSFKTTNHGKQGTYIPYDPTDIVLRMATLNLNDTPFLWCIDFDGTILPYHQIYIDNASNWNTIAARIANGESLKMLRPGQSRELVLNSNITVSTMLGTEQHPFDGTFDGQNHTLTFNLTTDESGCAPFRYIKNAEIKNLKIAGTLQHSVGAKTRLAGVAAYTSGYGNWMENITVTSTIRSQASSFHHAGLVAQINGGGVTFQNCIFKGKLLCDANSSACGGLVAVNMGSTRFNNCVFAPTECTVGTDNSSTISRDIKQPSLIINTYYTQELGDLQGTRCYTTAPDNVFCRQWSMVNGQRSTVNYYLPVATYISGLQHTYNYNDGNPINISYDFYCYQNKLYRCEYTATIRKATDGTVVKPNQVKDIGSYILAITGYDKAGYYGTVERPFYVTASSLTMNDQGHFLINTANDWNTLCSLSSDAHQEEYQYFEGRVVELTADIAVNQPLPAFSGTLAGNGHTLTFNYGTAANPITSDGAAPIYNLRGNAVVENLHVVGTIFTSTARYTSGLVGSVGSEGTAQHNVRINNCRSSIRIKTTYNGECHNGGFVGFARNGKLTFNNCLFDGCFTNEDANHVATHWAGFVGYKGDAEVSFNSCLYFANRHEMQVPSANNATFYLPTNASSVSLRNCCHTEQNWVNKQGTYVAANDEADPQMAALDYVGWYIAFGYPQWQAYYQEGQEWPLVLPRYDYHTAVAGHIEGLEGNGTAADPYFISTTDDWNLFAASINNNNVGAEAYYKLADDITIDQSHTVGTTVQYPYVGGSYGERRAFRGTFDGNGHTLTLNYGTAANPITSDGAAPIYNLRGNAVVENLHVVGTIFTSTGRYTSGLVGSVGSEGEAKKVTQLCNFVTL